MSYQYHISGTCNHTKDFNGIWTPTHGRRNALKGSETEKAPKVQKTKAKSNKRNHAEEKITDMTICGPG